ALVLTTGQRRREPPAPASPAHFLPQLRQYYPERLRLHPIQNLSHLCIRGDLLHAEDGLQITAPPLLGHRPLKLQQTRMLEKHQRKATHQGIGEGVPQLLLRSDMRYCTKPVG